MLISRLESSCIDALQGVPGRYKGVGGYESLVSFSPLVHKTKPPHTLVLGTVPSINSFDRGQYYATCNNAFWHIVGDALGHRRKEPDGGWRNKNGSSIRIPDFIQSNLLYPNGPYMDYASQVEEMLNAGFAIWDVLGTCDRIGATDSKIKATTARPNNIREFCTKYPSIRKICFASGASTATYFRKFNKEWLANTDAFTFASNNLTQSVFSKYIKNQRIYQSSSLESATPMKRRQKSLKVEGKEDSKESTQSPIHLVVMYSVSPAYTRPWKNTPEAPEASKYMYTDKRAFWFVEAFGLDVPNTRRHFEG